MLPGDLAEALSALAIAKDGVAVEIERPAADVTAFEAGTAHAGAGNSSDRDRSRRADDDLLLSDCAVLRRSAAAGILSLTA